MLEDPAAPRYVFAVCQLGAEATLKREVAARHAELRFAYSRPGLITWRAPAPLAADFELGAVFARAWGASLGAVAEVADIVALGERLRAGGAKLRLHVWSRDRHRPGEELDAEPGIDQDAQALRGALLAAGRACFHDEPLARAGERVLDVIVAADEPPWVGTHTHGRAHSPFAGGRIPIELPAEAPSRAYRKLEEALAWSALPIARGQVAVEIGSSPGGASYALLRRGVLVWGVDPGAMDARVLAMPGFTHLPVTMGALRLEQLPARVDWLLCDVNLAPQVALHGLRRIVSGLRRSLRGTILTLKLNDWAMADEVPDLLARIEGMGLSDVRATQLPSNRREICVVARGKQ